MQTLSLSLNITLATTTSFNNNNSNNGTRRKLTRTIYSCNLQCDKCEMRKRYRFYNREKKAFNKRNPVERTNASHRAHHCEPWFYVRLMQMRWIERSMNNRIWCDKRTSKNRVRNVLASIPLFFFSTFFLSFFIFVGTYGVYMCTSLSWVCGEVKLNHSHHFMQKGDWIVFRDK